MMSNDEPSHKFDTFQVWKEYQGVAMHFNDLLMRLRSQSLGAVAAFAALASVVLKYESDPVARWGGFAGVFALLLLFWVAIWILDFAYYNRLLIGAVEALLTLEKDTREGIGVSELTLSTNIEAAVAKAKGIRQGRLAREKAKWAFYIIVCSALAGGLVISVCSAGGPKAIARMIQPRESPTPVASPTAKP